MNSSFSSDSSDISRSSGVDSYLKSHHRIYSSSTSSPISSKDYSSLTPSTTAAATKFSTDTFNNRVMSFQSNSNYYKNSTTTKPSSLMQDFPHIHHILETQHVQYHENLTQLEHTKQQLLQQLQSLHSLEQQVHFHKTSTLQQVSIQIKKLEWELQQLKQQCQIQLSEREERLNQELNQKKLKLEQQVQRTEQLILLQKKSNHPILVNSLQEKTEMESTPHLTTKELELFFETELVKKIHELRLSHVNSSNASNHILSTANSSQTIVSQNDEKLDTTQHSLFSQQNPQQIIEKTVDAEEDEDELGVTYKELENLYESVLASNYFHK